MEPYETQIATAKRFRADPLVPQPDLRVGIARNVRSGLQPLNALRHQPDGDTSGWFVWAGDELSDAPDFFVSLHVSHVGEWCPTLQPYLALPPGWRILLAPGYEDVWFDEHLLRPRRTTTAGRKG
ncbi:immunity protein Imm33 domain-containing protein [Agromyces rhizosphaerae]